MIYNKKIVVISIIIPILALLAVTVYRHYMLISGKEVVLSITGYDPRSILSGHYLVYRVDYKVDGICHSDQQYEENKRQGYVCLNPQFFSYAEPTDCELFIKGVCRYTHFYAGIEQ